MNRRLTIVTSDCEPRASNESVTGAGPEPGVSVTRGRRERQFAARSILASHPDWHDRRIGHLCGVSPRAVGRVRLQLAEATARFLEQTNVQERDLDHHNTAVPLSWLVAVSHEARRRAAFWTQLAELIESRATRAGG